MYTSLIVVCLAAGAIADPLLGYGPAQAAYGQNYQQAANAGAGNGAGDAYGYGQQGYGGVAGEQAEGSATAQQSSNAGNAARIEASGANRDDATAGMRRRQSVLLAADQEEGAGFEGSAASEGSAGGSRSASSHGYCGGISMTGNSYLCCEDQYYGDTWSELSCCGNSIYDTRFYGCKNNVMAPLYRPVSNQPSDISSGSNRPNRLCGNYVWQMYKAPYELCCEGVHYPNPYANYGCCGARAYDNRYYSCGRDEVKQKWYTYKRQTFVLAATEEVEAVGSRSQSGVGRLTAEEAGYANQQASAAERAAARNGGAQGANQAAGQAGAQGYGQQAGNDYAGAGAQGQQSAYGPYFQPFGGAAAYPGVVGYGK